MKEIETNEKDTIFIERENEEIEEEKETRTCSLAELIWNKSEKNKRTIKGIPKITYYRKFGTSSVLANASKETPKITRFGVMVVQLVVLLCYPNFQHLQIGMSVNLL